jgi:hypothetical protein
VVIKKNETTLKKEKNNCVFLTAALSPNATSDSVIQRVPAWNNNCTQSYGHNTELIVAADGSSNWIIWKYVKCAQSDIALSVSCKFVINDADIKSTPSPIQIQVQKTN